MRARPNPAQRRQRGVAVITALLLTTLAISIVASLFWQQQVQVRSMENQRLHLQTRWILRGALDWSALVLRQDAQDNGKFTALTQVWATPLAETRLDQYIERERVEGEVFDASLSGNIEDATSRYNLRNLAKNNLIDSANLAIFQRLLTNLQINPTLARSTANLIAAGEPLSVTSNIDTTTNQPNGNQGSEQSDVDSDTASDVDASAAAGTLPVSREGIGTPIRFMEVDDLLAVPGMTPQMVERLRPYVTVLPERTLVNVNTASAEVLAAMIPQFSLSEANALLARRRNVPWNELTKFQTELGGKAAVADTLDVKSDWFFVNSRIRLDRAALNAQSLIHRGPVMGGGVQVVWVRQN